MSDEPRKRGRPTKYKPEYCGEALHHIGERGKSITWLAKHLGVARQTLYDWSKEHPEFLDALTHATEWAEAVWEDRVEVWMTDPKANAALIKLWMANRFGWSDKQTNAHTGADGGPVEVKITHEIIDPASADD